MTSQSSRKQPRSPLTSAGRTAGKPEEGSAPLKFGAFSQRATRPLAVTTPTVHLHYQSWIRNRAPSSVIGFFSRAFHTDIQ